MSERWRELAEVDHHQFQEWFRREINSRRDTGRVKYHAGEQLPVFKGEPLDQAIEEALDLIFYLWVEKRKQLGRNDP